MMLGNAVSRVRLFLFRARRDDAAWSFPVKRSNAVMDENGRALDIVFLSVMGIYPRDNYVFIAVELNPDQWCR